MPRQNRRRVGGPARPPVGSSQRVEDWHGEQYTVRSVTGPTAGKVYRCPGCDQEIRPGVAHLVTWPCDALDADGRRHWHRACWAARERRGPGELRSRNAPRY